MKQNNHLSKKTNQLINWIFKIVTTLQSYKVITFCTTAKDTHPTIIQMERNNIQNKASNESIN